MKAFSIKTFRMAILLIVPVMMLHAQTWQWAKNFGSANDDYANSVCSDQSGNIFLSTRIFFPYGVVGIDTIPISGLYDIFITKIDRSGAYLWTKQAGGYNPNGGIESADDILSDLESALAK